jgi:hypothetical protein
MNAAAADQQVDQLALTTSLVASPSWKGGSTFLSNQRIELPHSFFDADGIRKDVL